MFAIVFCTVIQPFISLHIPQHVIYAMTQNNPYLVRQNIVAHFAVSLYGRICITVKILCVYFLRDNIIFIFPVDHTFTYIQRQE